MSPLTQGLNYRSACDHNNRTICVEDGMLYSLVQNTSELNERDLNITRILHKFSFIF